MRAKSGIIVGANSTYGRAAAAALSESNVRLGLLDESFDGLPAELDQSVDRHEVVLYRVDLQNTVAYQEAIEAFGEDSGGIDFIVNASWEIGPDDLWSVTEADLKRAIDVNMKLPFFAMQACVPFMRARGGGRIINISSTRSEISDGGSSPLLGMTKAGLNSLTRQWAVDLSPDNVQANCLWVTDENVEKERLTAKVGSFAKYLALNAPSHINAAQIIVDSGETALNHGRQFSA